MYVQYHSLAGTCLLVGLRPPEEKDNPRAPLVDRLDGRVRHLLPSSVLVRVGLAPPDGEHRVEQQHPLTGPAGQLAVLGADETLHVGLQLLEHVEQAGRGRDAPAHGEAQSVCLAGTVVRVLAKNDHSIVQRKEAMEGSCTKL